MSKKTFYIIIVSIILVFAIVFGLYIFNNAKNSGKTVGEAVKDFFPFGRGLSTDPINETPTPDGSGEGPGQIPDGEIPEVKTARLRKVSTEPVAGYVASSKPVLVDPTQVAPKTLSISPTYTQSRELKLNSTGEDVRELQKLLNQCPTTIVSKTGAGSKGREGTRFDTKTQIALVSFQEMFKSEILTPKNLEKGTGVLDEATRIKINAPFVCTYEIDTPETIDKPLVRYAEKGTGNIYDAFQDSLESKRLTNTTIPRIYEAMFANTGKTVIMRYVRDNNQTIESFVANIPEEKLGGDGPADLRGTFLGLNIKDISVSPDTKQIFYLEQLGEHVIGIISNPDGSNGDQVFKSPFTGWLSTWPNSKTITLTTKASGYAEGYIYNLTITNQSLKKIVGKVSGLTTLTSHNERYVLFSQSIRGGMKLFFYDTTTGILSDTNLATLPEKCIWNKNSTIIYCAVGNSIPNAVYPDDWYQGKVEFSDSIYSIDPTGTYANSEVANLNVLSGENIDVIKIGLSLDNEYLYFINKKDAILWQLKIIEN
jgi:hypothetical protein